MSIMESNSTKPKRSSLKLLTREQTAWVILLTAFAIFVFFFFAIPFSGWWYFENASVSQVAQAQGTTGLTLLSDPNLRADAVVQIAEGEKRADLIEGSILRTDASSQILIEFFDRSTLTIFPNSHVTLSEMRRPRFAGRSQPERIVIVLSRGRVRAQVATNEPDVDFQIQTLQAPAPQGGIVLETGSYAIETSNEVTHVSVRSGVAFVRGQTGREVKLESNERAEIQLGSAALGPLAAKRNLLVNSDFRKLEVSEGISEGVLAEGWMVASSQGGDGGEMNGTVEVLPTSSTRSVHFVRRNSEGNHGQTSVEQQVNKLVGDYLSLFLRLDVRVVDQSLSGAGRQSSEFPLIVRVDYKNQYGDPQHWTQGFYCKNPAGYNVIGGSQIPCDTRVSFERDLLKENTLDNPLTIERIILYASGWDWEVYVSDLELIAE
ncbi:MAG: FecR domain-containing protein [Ardenticatenaceae bacterium]